MQKFLFDREIINNQLSVLNNTLNSQRQTKKTLLSYLEKFSNAMYDNFNSENTDLLLTLINEARSVFECIKLNISKTLELKKFLENISKSDSFNTIDSEKFNTEFNSLLENISKTNNNYLNFMNNYENFINTNLKINIPETTENTVNFESEIVQETVTFESESETEFVQENTETIENEVSQEDVTSEVKSEPESVQENTETIENEATQEAVTFEVESENNIPSSTQLQEKVLIINKQSGIAILPYSISDLDKLFLDNPEKYSSIQDIIDKEYTVPLVDFENTSISRYKEAFKLAKEKSNYSFSQAANFAKDLLIENKVTTLIIAACKNIDELKSYIECLNNNQLENFNCFKIIEKNF